MKITFKDKNEVTFGTLSRGATFINPEYDEEEVFVLVEPVMDVDIKPDTDIVDEDEYYGYAVSIREGYLMGFTINDKVIPVEVEVIVER